MGNCKLNLPLPGALPKGCRLLLRMCWKPEPEKRPTFEQILSHLFLTGKEFQTIPPEVYHCRQEKWRAESRAMLCRTRISFNNPSSDSSSSQDVAIVEKTANLYNDMVQILSQLAQYEQQLGSNSNEAQHLLAQVINDPTYQSTLQLCPTLKSPVSCKFRPVETNMYR